MSRPRNSKIQKKEPEAKAVKTEQVSKDTILRPHIEIADQRLLISQTMLAKAFGVTIDMVGKWDVKPVVKRSREALFYLPEVINYKMGNGDTPRLNPQQEKALLDKVRRERAELDLQKERGEITTISEVEKKLEKELIAARQKLLAIPNNLPLALRGIEDPIEINNILTAAILEALEGLNYGGRIKFADSSVDSKNAASAAEAQLS